MLQNKFYSRLPFKVGQGKLGGNLIYETFVHKSNKIIHTPPPKKKKNVGKNGGICPYFAEFSLKFNFVCLFEPFR